MRQPENIRAPLNLSSVSPIFFKRSFGILVIRAPHLKKNLYSQEVQSESVDAYRQGRIALEKKGYTVQAIVLDGRPGVRQLFVDIPVQMCHFHQKQIITRYLTNNPKLESGIELKKLTATLCKTNESDFTLSLMSGTTHGLPSSRKEQQTLQQEDGTILINDFARPTGV
jgi:hypothetical protein